MNGSKEIAEMMQGFRDNPPKQINGSDVVELRDYLQQLTTNVMTGATEKINLPKSNVLQFILDDGTKISARPSGTEPKIKFYFSVHTELAGVAEIQTTEKKLDDKIQAIISDMKLK